MASPIVPKSEMRKIRHITVGFGTIPTIEINGISAWALPGKLFTFCEQTAREAASNMDRVIKENMTSHGQLLG